MRGSYINQYIERLIQIWMQNFEDIEEWAPETNIHKGMEKPVMGDSEGGVSGSQRKTPLIEIICRQAEPVVPNFQGTWNVSIEITVINSTRDTTDRTHEDRVDMVLEKFYKTEFIQDLITLEPNFFAHRLIPGPTTEEIEGISFKSCGYFTLLGCCAQQMQALTPDS